jgi:hypothetical protein
MASKHNVEAQADGQLLLTGICPVSKESWMLCVDKEDYDRWQAGELIQVVWPDMHAAHRELLISGITDKGWEKTFGPDEED